jgi:hypothetical protein
MVDHGINLRHCIQLHDTSILAKISRCMECKHKQERRLLPEQVIEVSHSNPGEIKDDSL